MHLLLPLTTGHLSNVATISWQKDGHIRKGRLYYQTTCRLICFQKVKNTIMIQIRVNALYMADGLLHVTCT